MLRISIPQPCHERWENMTPLEKGAYCKNCASTITDCTGMSDRELADYFSNKKEQKTCGRFLNTQLKRPLDIVSPEVLWMDIPAWKKYLAILFICFSGFLTGCSSSSLDFEYPLPETVQLSPRNVQLESLNCKQEKNMPGTNTGKDDIDNKQENTQIIVLGNVHTDYVKDLLRKYNHQLLNRFSGLPKNNKPSEESEGLKYSHEKQNSSLLVTG